MTTDGTQRQGAMSVHLSSRDVTRSIAFYTEALGFRCTASYPEQGPPVWASLELDGQKVMVASPMSEGSGTGEWAEFHRRNQLDFDATPCGGVLVYLEVPDIDAFHARVVERGVTTAGDPVTQFYGIRDLPLRDPDGHRLVFYSTTDFAHGGA